MLPSCLLLCLSVLSLHGRPTTCLWHFVTMTTCLVILSLGDTWLHVSPALWQNSTCGSHEPHFLRPAFRFRYLSPHRKCFPALETVSNADYPTTAPLLVPYPHCCWAGGSCWDTSYRKARHIDCEGQHQLLGSKVESPHSSVMCLV